MMVLAIIVVAVSSAVWCAQWRRRKAVPVITLPAYVDEAAPATVPRYGSRRWARACFHNGFITIEELQQFYGSHAESFSDPDR